MATIARWLELLPERLRHYRGALAAGSITAEAEAQAKLCAVFEWLLEDDLAGCCRQVSMVDGVIPARIDISDPAAVAVVGVAIWCGAGGWFSDPLSARAELYEGGKAVRSYWLRFGDAATGLGKFPVEPRAKDLHGRAPEQWCFVFGQPAAGRSAVGRRSVRRWRGGSRRRGDT
jgi:hypothetical protein